jgi:hypothetical protein
MIDVLLAGTSDGVAEHIGEEQREHDRLRLEEQQLRRADNRFRLRRAICGVGDRRGRRAGAASA